MAVGLVPDVADQPSQAGTQELDPFVHAFELLGVGVRPAIIAAVLATRP